MTARLLDGIKIRDEVFAELRLTVAELYIKQHVRPGLAAVLVGENPASQLYVKSKIEASHHLGLSSWLHTPSASSTTDDLLRLVDELNRDYRVDGILIQLPLPKQVDAKRVLEAVDPAKDVDGFHPINLGRLVSGRPGLVACTPAGCMEILRRNHIPIEGANAVVLGRSDIVGKPMALLLMHANATVTICHSKTRDLPDVVRRGDTLWSICDEYFQNPYQWPRIWSYNPQLQNPHWIYPGDQIRLTLGGNTATMPGRSLPLGEGNLIEQRRMVAPDTVFLRDEGYVEDEKGDNWGEVSGAPEDHMLLGDFDQIYLRVSKAHEVKIGQELTIFRPTDGLEFHIDLEIRAIAAHERPLQRRGESTLAREDLHQIIPRHPDLHGLHARERRGNPRAVADVLSRLDPQDRERARRCRGPARRRQLRRLRETPARRPGPIPVDALSRLAGQPARHRPLSAHRTGYRRAGADQRAGANGRAQANWASRRIER